MEVINIILNFKAFDDAHKAQYHRRRKILKVEGAKDTIAREARANFSITPTWGQTTPIFARSRLLYNAAKSFSMKERTVSQVE